jgi:Peptidase inhibitor I78 family
MPIRLRHTVVAAAALAVCACNGADAQMKQLKPMPETGVGTCDQDAVQWAVGQPASDDVLERARQQAGATRVRVIGVNSPVTQEFAFGRLNAIVNAAGIIVEMRCF